MEVSIGRDMGLEPSNRECPDHIGAVGTYAFPHCKYNLMCMHIAVIGPDYTPAFSTVFPAGSQSGARECIFIPTTDDSAIEGDETFTVSLATMSNVATVNNPTATITITDNDG